MQELPHELNVATRRCCTQDTAVSFITEYIEIKSEGRTVCRPKSDYPGLLCDRTICQQSFREGVVLAGQGQEKESRGSGKGIYGIDTYSYTTYQELQWKQ